MTPDAVLLIFADALDDLERTRVATENRIRSLGEFGLGDTPVAMSLCALLDSLAAFEHEAELNLKRALRMHPLGLWVKRTVGIGEKQGARLLASIGDPYLRANGTPRTVSQLWAYCGYHVLSLGQLMHDDLAVLAQADPLGADHSSIVNHVLDVGADSLLPSTSDVSDAHGGPVDGSHSSDPGQGTSDSQSTNAGVAPARRKGQRASWNATAKMRAFLCAEAAVKAGVRKLDACDDTNGYDLDGRKAISPLGQTYLDGRAKYADAVHPAPCVRCGPGGRPALTASSLNDGHKHARALRLVAKEILKDLWRESKSLDGDR